MIDFVKNEEINLDFQNGFAQSRVLKDVYPLVQVYRGAIWKG